MLPFDDRSSATVGEETDVLMVLQDSLAPLSRGIIADVLRFVSRSPSSHIESARDLPRVESPMFTTQWRSPGLSLEARLCHRLTGRRPSRTSSCSATTVTSWFEPAPSWSTGRIGIS